MAYITQRIVARAVEAVIKITESYKSKGAPRSEQKLDPALFAFLLGCGLKVERQPRVEVQGQGLRIDFKTFGGNPSFIEWAVRPPKGGNQLSGHSNKKELAKLSRKDDATRYLLLVDLTRKSWKLDLDELDADYDSLPSLGPGKFTRNSVNVIYVHRTDVPVHVRTSRTRGPRPSLRLVDHRFIWWPR